MAISDKNRKILWGKSASMCAICRHPLVIDPTETDTESVVGDECHIISGAKNGPRSDPDYPRSKIDDLSNLILLCRVHHKQVDDQVETYTVDILRQIKNNHEKWIDEKLKDENKEKPLGIRRLKENIPEKLKLIQSGKELLNLAMGCHGSYKDYPDDLDSNEADMVGGFMQDIADWADLGLDFEPAEKIRAAQSISESIGLLKDNGFLVFAASENQIMEGRIKGPSTFHVLHLTVTRVTDENIVFSDPE